MELKFDEKGLIPAIVQDHYTKEVLTLAYMNKESLAITIDERRTCFWSRSRQELWRKGDTSGAVQHVVAIYADCDCDALVVEVVKDGPACHTGAESCFFNELYLSDELKQFSYEGLYNLIAGRKTNPKDDYPIVYFAKGTHTTRATLRNIHRVENNSTMASNVKIEAGAVIDHLLIDDMTLRYNEGSGPDMIVL